MTDNTTKPAGLLAIEAEMAHQHADALTSYSEAGSIAAAIAASLRQTGRLLLLGMGGSHAVGRAVEPLYRDLGIDAIALPLSEQLGQPLSTKNCTIIVTSQSGESAEVLRWFAETGVPANTFGLTLEAGSTLAHTIPSLAGHGGTELAFAATRSLTITFALHLSILTALGTDPELALDALKNPVEPDLTAALAALSTVDTVVTSGRRLQGVAEAAALGLTELSRLPCYALEGGQLRHGPMEMLGPRIGVILFRAKDATSALVAGMAQSAMEAGARVVMFDTSGEPAVDGVITVALPAASGMAAILTLLPAAQRFMVAFAAARVENVGTPVRSTKITRSE